MTELGSKVQRCVSIVREIVVLDMARIVFDYAFQEGEVVKVNGAADADGGVNHFWCKLKKQYGSERARSGEEGA